MKIRKHWTREHWDYWLSEREARTRQHYSSPDTHSAFNIWIVAEIRLWCAAQWLCVHPNSIKMWTAAMCPKRWRSILRGRCKEIILFPAHLSDALLLQLAFFLRSIINSPGSLGSRGWGRSLFCRGKKYCGGKYFQKTHFTTYGCMVRWNSSTTI